MKNHLSEQQLFDILELIGKGFNNEVCIIDNNLNILWVNSVLENKGFHISAIKNTPYYCTFDNLKKPDEDDPTYRAIKKGETINTIKMGADMNKYQLVVIPIKDDGGRTRFVISFTRNMQEYGSEEIKRLKDFLLERELKMVELKRRVNELENGTAN